MARPKEKHPTPAELEVLKALWERGPMTVREVMDALEDGREPRAYTSVMSLLNVMTEKGLLRRRPQGRAFVYAARAAREKTLGQMVGDLWQRAFERSTESLVAHLLEETSPTPDELDEIRRLIESYQQAERN